MKIMQNLLEVYLRNHDMRDSVLGALQVLLKICGDDFKVFMCCLNVYGFQACF